MFGIGLPEMILILALALIVVGPDKLPELARSVAKGIMELKKTAEGLKDQLAESGNPLDDIKPELEDAAKKLKKDLLELPDQDKSEPIIDPVASFNKTAKNAADAYQELMKQTGITGLEHTETEQPQNNESAVAREEEVYQQAVESMEIKADNQDSSSGTDTSAQKA